MADDPELIFKKTTVWRFLSPDAKLATYVIDDPEVEGVACYFTVPEIGGWSGWAGFAEERSETSLACRQVGPIKFTAKFSQGDDIYRERARVQELEAALQRAYTDGAAAVLNSEVFEAYVPTRARRGLRAWNFGRSARRAAARRNSTED